MDDIDGQLVGGLMVLAAIADAKSFGRAAERLGMTQSGVSKAIAKLEARLGARLVHRTSRAVELTDEGHALCERVAGHLAGIGEAAAETAKSRDAVRGRLRVNVDPLFSRMVCSPRSSPRSSSRTRAWSCASKPGTASPIWSATGSIWQSVSESLRHRR